MGGISSPMSRGRSRSAGSTRPIRCRSRSTSPTGSCSASGWRTTSGSRSACGTRSTGRAPTSSASGTFDRPWLDPGVGPDDRGPGEARRGVRVPRQARRAVLLLPRSRRRPGGRARSPRRRRTSTRCVDAGRGAHGADRRAAPVGHGQPVQPSALRGRRGDEPGSRGVRLRRGPGQGRCSRRRKRLGGANYVLWGGREGYETLLNTDLAREEAQLARFLTLVAEHKHRIGFKGTLLIEPKPQEPTKHQYDYDAATVLGFLARHGLDGRVPAEPRGQPRDAGRPQLPPRGRLRDRARHLRQHRRQPRRLPERLGHGPVPELGRRAVAGGLRDPARRRVHDRRLQLRHEAAPPEPGPDRPLPRPHRRHRHARPVAARGGRR